MGSLSKVLSGYRDRTIHVVSAGGNWGDGLIWRGAESLFSRQSIKYINVELNDFCAGEAVEDGAVIYIHGGGGFNSWCSGRVQAALLKAVSVVGATVIQGPQSIEGCELYTQQLVSKIAEYRRASRVIFFVREHESYRRLANSLDASVAELMQDEDTAFHLEPDELRKIAGCDKKGYRLAAIREDVESPGGVCSSLGRGRTICLDPAVFASSFEHWVRIHAGASEIVTNRTHSAIAGAILGIPTTLSPGSYHKNRSVWDYSLRNRGVKWQVLEFEQVQERVSRFGDLWRSSYKVSKMRDFLAATRRGILNFPCE